MNKDSIINWFKLPPTEELLTEERLIEYINMGLPLKHYIGFEISGFVHLGTGLMCMQKVADLQKVGVKTTVFLADCHSWINRKLNGDLDTIRKVAGGYFKEALKISIKIAGGDPDDTEFILGSKLYEKIGLSYLENIVKVSMNTTFSRVKRSLSIMGRRREEVLHFSDFLYPIMQVADIFSLNVNVAHGGMDQRKAHIIAIEIGEKVFGYKPIALHHHILMGLNVKRSDYLTLINVTKSKDEDLIEDKLIEIKMSKSKPEGAIFIHDDEDTIKNKILNAFCPPTEVDYNPILELIKYIIIRHIPENCDIEIINRKTNEYKKYRNYKELEYEYIKGRIHPLDLKLYVAEKLINILEPAIKYFRYGPGTRYLEEMNEILLSHNINRLHS
ncbi:MAG: tyrosine--tRNA ligase [Candidatus Methanomethylicia archaeon]|nr:tyrosine--tRNA ligase [Candidatus Methanomethylicia archaeon]MCX8169314.1 tyrosine--tRNA ligase [Candidatus Methanomethylicia archaeon]MDW7988903.1 tyrosine--tRNA ligase [Nitrososphaerota archaeon]